MKYNVIAYGSRDDYQVALALNEEKKLGKLITDFYCPNILRSLLKKRFNTDLTSRKTISIAVLLVPFIVASKINKSCAFLLEDVFGFIAGFLTDLMDNSAIVYSYYAIGFLKYYKTTGRKPKEFIIFQVHPVPNQIKKILKSDREISNIKFKLDDEELMPQKRIDRLSNALMRADKIIVASGFTKRGLIESGIDKDKIYVSSYGVNKNINLVSKSKKNKLNILYVGQLVQRKAPHILLDAIRILDNSTYKLTIVSKHIDPEIEKLISNECILVRGCSGEKLKDLYREADVFTMPSLVEGFGLVYLESLSYGTPIICTTNSGGADIIKNNEHGFIVQPGDVEDLKKRLLWCVENKNKVRDMSEACVKLANAYPWSSFRNNIKNIVISK